MRVGGVAAAGDRDDLLVGRAYRRLTDDTGGRYATSVDLSCLRTIDSRLG
jgi:hypothetical protein